MQDLLYFDNLSLLMIALVSFVGLNVGLFSFRYLKGDRKQGVFYFNLICIILSVFVMVSADHLGLLFVAWALSNLLLTRLMLHKREWQAAHASSLLALKNFMLGLVFLGSAFLCMYYATEETSIKSILKIIIKSPADRSCMLASSCLLFLCAMTQSALWPFHHWLISSLNSPTPVSAIMHAGLVNGGGFILARFAPIFLEQPFSFNIIFIAGIVTALLGTLWKLMQSDIKRMLACSTMGQMGFMMAQCGLGLFPAAIAHLCWHGLFKAYLFLASGGVAQEKRLDLEYPPKISHFMLALICGAVGAYVFALISNKNILARDTNLFLIVLALIAGTQFALSIVRSKVWFKIPMALFATIFAGAIYGLSVHCIELLLSSLNIAVPQSFNLLHGIALLMLITAWLTIVFGRRPINKKQQYSDWALAFYVRMLNASQPHPNTVTTHRNQYQF